MKVTFFIDREQQVIIEHFQGDVTIANVVEVFPHIWNHPDYSPVFDGIVDFRDCNFLFSTEELQMLMKTISDNAQGMRGRAAIMVSEPMSAAMGTLYSEQMKDIHSAAIFCSNSEAIHFLNVDPAIFKKLADPEAVRVEIG